jgi:hypothetical protein
MFRSVNPFFEPRIREEFAMGSRLLKIALTVLFSYLLQFSSAATTQALAVDCPNGTHYDTILQRCV